MENVAINVATGVLTYFVHSAAACVVAFLLSRFLQRPHDRDLLWKTALVAPLATSALSILIATTGNGWTRIDLAEVARHVGLFTLPGRRMMVRVFDDGQNRVIFRQLTDPVTSGIAITALVVASCCMMIAIVRFVNRRRALSRALSGRQHICNLAVDDNCTVRLSTANDLQSPVALGGPEICLPVIVMNDFSTEHRDTLVAHEIAHLRRNDPTWFFAVEIISALSAFQPLVFLVVRAFRRDVELICDEAAVRRTGDRHSLVSALALLASPFDPRSPLLGAATAYDGSPLVMRATRIVSLSLDEQQSRHVRTIVLAMVMALVASLVAFPVVSASPDMNAIPTDLTHIKALVNSRRHLVLLDSTVTERSSRVTVILK